MSDYLEYSFQNIGNKIKFFKKVKKKKNYQPKKKYIYIYIGKAQNLLEK